MKTSAELMRTCVCCLSLGSIFGLWFWTSLGVQASRRTCQHHAQHWFWSGQSCSRCHSLVILHNPRGKFDRIAGRTWLRGPRARAWIPEYMVKHLAILIRPMVFGSHHRGLDTSRRPHVLSIALGCEGMVLACPCLAMRSQELETSERPNSIIMCLLFGITLSILFSFHLIIRYDCFFFWLFGLAVPSAWNLNVFVCVWPKGPADVRHGRRWASNNCVVACLANNGILH